MMCVCIFLPFDLPCTLKRALHQQQQHDHGRFKKRQSVYNAKENVIKNHHFPEYFFETLSSIPFHLSKGAMDCDCECVWLWTSMIMILMNTYRHFRFILYQSANEQSPNEIWEDRREKSHKKKEEIFAMFATNLTTESCQIVQ